MGIWEDVRWVVGKLIHRKSSSSGVDYSLNLTNISKFAVDHTIKDVSGGVQVYRTAKEGLKDHPSSDGNKNQGLLVVMEEMLANMEKTKDGTSNVKQHHRASSLCNEGLDEPLNEFSDEPVKSSIPQENGRRRIFIRSRL
ncbi:hypothetical protein LIER_41654 [Lithospermum erythrorhizon]|uniref:Uncharacterized protein n=1 Tax=Lithospermum erythrorhizon TaxID=34254 RepID=A0AAV3REF6_LITER